MTTLTVPFLAGALFATVAVASAQDHTAAVMYVQSFMAPAMIEVCRVALPGSGARQEALLVRWREKNRETIAQGERDLRAARRGEGTSLEAALDSKRDALLQQLRAMSEPARIERCLTLMDILESESR